MSVAAPPLEILPVAGLANRLRAIASAICGAEDLGRPLVVLWSQQHGIFHGRPDQLFDVRRLPFFVEDIGFRQPTLSECLSPSDWTKAIATATADPHKPLQIKSYGHFHQSDPGRWTTALRSLHPHPKLLAARDRLLAEATGRRLIGVHIRRTDHMKSIRESPTEAFVAAMGATVAAADGPVAFFVATDDPREREALQSQFPNQLVGGSNPPPRDSEGGGAAAFLDLLCLASCSEILGSVGSSFSEIAAAWGDVPLRLVRKTPL